MLSEGKSSQLAPPLPKCAEASLVISWRQALLVRKGSSPAASHPGAEAGRRRHQDPEDAWLQEPRLRGKQP